MADCSVSSEREEEPRAVLRDIERCNTEGKPILYDLFSGAGGAGWGYHLAGFFVVGVDIKDQPRYAGDLFYRADALTFPLEGAQAVHASPPCQRWAEAGTSRKIGERHPDYLTPTRQRFKASGLPYVIENIPTAPMPDAFVLCGATFGLPIVRHRQFEVWPCLGLVPSLCHQSSTARSVSHSHESYPYASGSWEAAWREHVLPVIWPWMTLEEAGEAIPPAYTEWIGARLLEVVRQGVR